ncbi:prolipoprotein diacylglyceryl transferase [Nocardia stercoris]|uniref:Phosphatidylglycerol--prolipoprotein diacylglyceryl transferase n=1 Tax=Nocardia stercoris TaxID=2483361 RepID=A0A3M2KYW4_9NOCA|nr:prolipoprotein diacylglyceryl transferase [Nocardia stercoris]RMI29826.1 prolipoprotein diacylglyceryl transferase [Nocardia stercoris]
MTFPVLADTVVAHGASASVLAYIPSPPRGVWYLGPIPIRAYALCIIAGIIAAIWLGERRWTARGGRPGSVMDVAMFAVPFGLVGGRLYHVATDWEKYFGDGGHPMNAFKVWEGGLGIWGAVLLGGIGAWIGCRFYKIPLPAFGDAIAPGVLLAQAIGRLGNYFNQELYGRRTDLPWGLEIFQRFDADGRLDMMNGVSNGVVDHSMIVQPTFLYELLWNLIGVALLLYVDKRFRIGHGRLFALYVAIYCFGRFWVELLRDDDATHIFGLRVNTYTSTIVFVCAIAYFLLATRGREQPADLQPRPDRPWPWQLGALRAAGASAAAAPESDAAPSESGPADAETPDTEADSDPAEPADPKPDTADGDDNAVADPAAAAVESVPDETTESAEPADAGKN